MNLLQGALPNLPEMISDEEAQRTARKSALIVARMKDGSFRWEMEVLSDNIQICIHYFN